MKKQYIVFGAGKFGGSVARTLQEAGCEVIAVDKNPEVIQQIAGDVSYAICASIEDQEAFSSLPLKKIDAAIISTTEQLENSIILTMLCKENGIKRIVVKAQNDLHEKILRKVGATDIIYPEREMGRRVAKHLVADNIHDWIEITGSYSLIEMEVPKSWCGKSPIELGVREKHGINIIGIKNGDDVNMHVDPKKKLPKNAKLLVTGDNKELKKFQD